MVRGMRDGRSNAYVEAMNVMLQQTKRAARGFRTVTNFIAIAYLRMAKLKHLPANPLRTAVAREFGVTRHAAWSNSTGNGIEPKEAPPPTCPPSHEWNWRGVVA